MAERFLSANFLVRVTMLLRFTAAVTQPPIRAAYSLLAKHTRRGTTAWGMAYDSFAMLRGEASRVLQKQWGTTEANELYLAVEWVRRFPEELKNTSTPRTAGSIIQDAILRAIKAENPGSLDLLARCIVAVDKNFSENIEDYFSGRKATTLQKVALAIGNAAHRLGRIPTWQECLMLSSKLTAIPTKAISSGRCGGLGLAGFFRGNNGIVRSGDLHTLTNTREYS